MTNPLNLVHLWTRRRGVRRAPVVIPSTVPTTDPVGTNLPDGLPVLLGRDVLQ